MVRLTRFLAKRWQLMAALILMLAILAIQAVIAIPKSEDPIIRFPFANTVVVLPGANAEQMEQLVTIPIEQAVRRIEDVKEIYSESFDGVVNIGIEFKWGVDSAAKFDEVVREVNAIRGSLPQGVAAIEFIRADSSLANVAQLAITAPGAAPRRVEGLATDLRDALERVPGVQRSEIWGTAPSEIQVQLDLDRLVAARLAPTAVVQALRSQGLTPTIGALDAGSRRLNVQQPGRFRSLEDIRALPLTREGAAVLTLGSVAAVQWAAAEQRHLTRLNGREAVFVSVKADLNADIFAVQRGVTAVVDDFTTRLPPGAMIHWPFDQSRNVSGRLEQLGRDMLIAVLIVLLTLLPLGLRPSLIVMLSIPFSLALGVLLLDLLGFSLNQLSIAGFILALGLIVDDSIVVIEIIVRRMNEGLSAGEAAIRGMGEISMAVIGCTATVILAFLPLLFLPDSAGGFIRSLPAAVLVAVIASLIAALTVIPFLAGKLLRRQDSAGSNRLLTVVLGAIHRVYSPVVAWALANPTRTIAGSLLLVVATLPLVARLGFSLFPESDIPQFMIEVEAQQGASLAETDRAIRHAEAVLARRSDLDWYLANTGRGNPQVYYNFAPQRVRTTTGALFVSFKAWDADDSPRALDQIRTDLGQFPGARFTVRRFVNGPPVDAPIVVRLIGQDLATLEQLSQKVAEVVDSVAGVRDIDNRQAIRQLDIDLRLDADRVGLLGITPGSIDQLLAIAVSGQPVASYYDTRGQGYPVVVKAGPDPTFQASQLDRLYTWTPAGLAVPLATLVTPQLRSGPPQINRLQQERLLVIRGYAEPGYQPVDLALEIKDRLDRISLPAGYRISLGGQAEAAANSFGGLGPTVIITLFGIAIVLLLEFRGFGQALVVAFVIPFGVAGGIVALWIAGLPLSFTAAIGFITLIGIEIKNSILLVDLANTLRDRGMELMAAAIQAGEERFLPVLLTSLTAIGGLVPLIAEQSGLYSPLAIVIAGGLVSSTVIARIVTPVAYVALERRRDAKVARPQAPALTGATP